MFSSLTKSSLQALVELVCLLNRGYLQDLNQLVVLGYLIKDGKRPAHMHSIDIIFQVEKLLVSSLAGKRIIRKSMALLSDEPPTLLREL